MRSSSAAHPPAPSRPGPWPWLIPACISALLSLLLYSPSLDFGFIYDDEQIVMEDRRLADPTFILRLWTAPWWPGGSGSYESRPLTVATFWLQRQLGATTPAPYHALNIALFALLSAQVAGLAWQWTRRRRAPWIAGLLFAAHPIHVEVVAGIVGRAEMLSLAFSMLTVALYLRWRPRLTWGRCVLVGVTLLGSGLAKEHGYLTAAMLACLELALRLHKREPLSPQAWPWRLALVIAVVAALAIAQRWAVMHASEITLRYVTSLIDNPLHDASPLQRVVTPLKLLGKAAALLVAPVSQSADYSPRVLMPTTHLGDPLVLLGVAVAGAWLVAVIVAARRRSLVLGPLLVLPVTWFVASNTLVLIGTIFGERLLTAVSAWAAVAVASVAPDGPGRRSSMALAGVLAAATLAYSAATVFYLPAWRDTETMILASLTRQPDSGRFRGQLAIEIATRAAENPQAPRELLEEARKQAQMALELWPQQTQAYIALGIVAQQRGDIEEARQHLLTARSHSPRYGAVDTLLANLDGAQPGTDLQQRRAQLERQLAAKPDDPAIERQLAATYLQLKEGLRAEAIYSRLVTPQTADPRLLAEYIDALLLIGRHRAALDVYRRRVPLEPGDWTVLTNAALLGVALDGPTPEVRRWIDAALKINPGGSEAWAALGQWHAARDDRAAAVAAFRRAIELASPDDPRRAHYQLMLERVTGR